MVEGAEEILLEVLVLFLLVHGGFLCRVEFLANAFGELIWLGRVLKELLEGAVIVNIKFILVGLLFLLLALDVVCDPVDLGLQLHLPEHDLCVSCEVFGPAAEDLKLGIGFCELLDASVGEHVCMLRDCGLVEFLDERDLLDAAQLELELFKVLEVDLHVKLTHLRLVAEETNKGLDNVYQS